MNDTLISRIWPRCGFDQNSVIQIDFFFKTKTKLI